MPMRAISIAVLALAAVAACKGSVASSTLPITPSPPTPSPERSTYPPSAQAPAVGPPASLLAAEGGDPVTGQLGTYAWRNTGSDSPWLPGSPITIGAGEPLRVTFDQAVGVASWRARMVPAGSDGPAGATPLGQGPGEPTFQAPGPGSWTVEVHVVFEGGAGDASYFWRLDVT